MNSDNRLQKILLDTLKFSVAFFESHGLRYYACGGTMLGAVRHKGFIPWDDDIDIYMPRRDYERLILLREELKDTGFSLVSAQTDYGYYCPFAKIQKDDTTIWEFKYYPYLLGVYVDIFPLDYYDIPDEQLTALQWRYSNLFVDYQKSLKTYSFADYMELLRGGDVSGFMKNLYFRIAFKPRRRQMYERWMKATGYLSDDERGGKCVCLTQWQGRIFQRRWFEDCIDQPFEDTTIKVPRQYDEYLTLLYGNYMQMPPEEKRCSDHRHHYINLDRGERNFGI